MNWFIWSLLTALTWGCVPLLEKLGLLRIDPVVGIFYRCMGVVFGIVGLIIWKGRAIKSSLIDPPEGLWFLVLGGFLASVVGQIFFYHALKTGEASKVVPLAASYPLVSFILGIIFIGEQLTLTKAFGLGFILAGVFLLR